MRTKETGAEIATVGQGGPAASGFQPRVLAFLCNWCSYAGADLAGVSRFQYPASIRVVRVMCSGRVDPVFVLRALSRGADGVMVLGCHPGDCHYTTGNYYARDRAEVLKQLLEQARLESDRLMLDWVSAGEGERFAKLVSGFTERVRALGPLFGATATGDGSRDSAEAVRTRLAAAQRTAECEKLRWLVGRQRELCAKGDAYGRPVSEEAAQDQLRLVISRQYLRDRLLLLASEAPISVRSMAAALGAPPRAVLPHVVALEQAGQLAMAGLDGNSPLYRRA